MISRKKFYGPTFRDLKASTFISSTNPYLRGHLVHRSLSLGTIWHRGKWTISFCNDQCYVLFRGISKRFTRFYFSNKAQWMLSGTSIQQRSFAIQVGELIESNTTHHFMTYLCNISLVYIKSIELRDTWVLCFESLDKL